MKSFRKKPVVVQAVQFVDSTEAIELIMNWIPKQSRYLLTPATENIEGRKRRLFILTLEGEMEVSMGDWVIKGVEGEFYPCKPSVFEKTYDVVKE